MAAVAPGRMSAHLEGDFVVFLIGVRPTRPWHVRKLWLALTGMPRMLRHLYQNPESGLLAHTAAVGRNGPVVIQYWRSVEQLEAFARSTEAPHHPAWKKWNKLMGYQSADIGIWHESYQVRAGAYECLYGNMPRFGLALAGEHVPAARKGETAAERRRAAAPPTPGEVPVPHV